MKRLAMRPHTATRSLANLLVPAALALLLLATTSRQSAARPDSDNVPDGVLVAARVIDHASGEPMGSFRVLAGTENRGGDADCAIWQSHTIREATEGRFDWPLRRSYAKFKLRFEADGYKPFVTGWILKSDGPKAVTVSMEHDLGREIRVLDPEGEPAVGAAIAIALPNRGVRLENGKVAGSDKAALKKLRDRWDNPLVGETDERGRFHLPTEVSLAVVYVVHESGIAEVPYQQIGETPEIRLQAWGAIDGRSVWLDKPGANEKLWLGVSRDFGYPEFLRMAASVTTDAEGGFRVEKIPPGRVQLSRSFDYPDGNGSYLFPAIHVQVQSGEATQVVFGGRGRPVIGRLTGLDSWDGIMLGFAPSAPRPGWQRGWSGYSLVRQSNLGRVYFRDGFGVSVDGTFRLENVLPAAYQLFVYNKEKSVYTVRTFRVGSIPGGESLEPLDIGEVNVRRRKARAK